MKRTPLRRKTALKRTASLKAAPPKRLEPEQGITALKRDEPDPPGEPKHYLNAEGYTRLRWKIGKGRYVERYLRDEAGALVRNKRARRPGVDYELARDLYEDGWSLTRISAELCCDSGNLSRRLRRLGVTMRTTTEYYKPLDIDEVVRRYEVDKIGVTDLARELDISEFRLGNALRKRGVTRKPGTPGRRQSGIAYDTEFKHMRERILERSGGLCEIRTQRCTGQASAVHHRKRRGQGGENSEANLTATCDPCHSYVHGHPFLSYRYGWMVESWNDPAEVPLKPETRLPAEVPVRRRNANAAGTQTRLEGL